MLTVKQIRITVDSGKGTLQVGDNELSSLTGVAEEMIPHTVWCIHNKVTSVLCSSSIVMGTPCITTNYSLIMTSVEPHLSGTVSTIMTFINFIMVTTARMTILLNWKERTKIFTIHCLSLLTDHSNLEKLKYPFIITINVINSLKIYD